MSNKKSRFKLYNEENEVSVTFSDGKDHFHDDYMAPIELPTAPTSLLLHQLPKETLSKKRIHQLMEERVEEGLECPIPPSNKGFQLLRRFGYSGDSGLGKKGDGAPDPLTVQIRPARDHSGIGKRKDREKLKRFRANLEAEKETNRRQRDFLQETSSLYHRQKLMRDLDQAKKTIFELDLAADLPPHRLSEEMHALLSNTSSLDIPLGNSDNDDDGEEEGRSDGEDKPQEDPQDILYDCLDYLRRQHYYCFYCGIAFKNEEDLTANCPGLLDEDH
eukprot:gene9497-10494_t